MAETIRQSGLALAHVGEFLGIENLDPESGRIFVTGGMSDVGQRVVTRLLNAGYPLLRVGASDIDSPEEVKAMGAEISDFRWDKEETYEKALEGVKSVLFTLPYEEGWHTHFAAFLSACHTAKVKHLVKLSFYHARVPHDHVRDIPFVKHHAICDETLIVMVKRVNEVTFPKLSYTIVYATTCMSQALKVHPDNFKNDEKSLTMFGASSHGTNYVSPNDVSEVAVRVLLEPRAHYDREYTLTGPGPISYPLIADYLSKYLKKPVFYEDMTMDDFEKNLKASGKPDWVVADIVALEKLKASGTYEHLEFVSQDTEIICDHRPESFEDYLSRTDTMTTEEVVVPSELKPLKGMMTA